MNFVIGLAIALASLFGGFAALGGHLSVIWQPWEFVIIGGSALGTFIIANPLSTVFDAGKATKQAILGGSPKRSDYLQILALLYALMRELRGKSRNEAEAHVDNPERVGNLQALPEGAEGP